MNRLPISCIATLCLMSGVFGCSDDGDGGAPPMSATGGLVGSGGLGGASGGQPSGGGGGTSGTGGGATLPQAVAPTMNGSRYSFTTGELLFEVDPTIGGRVATLALGGTNLLTGPEVNSANWGSTFWVGPQSAWNWPPPAEIDSDPYTATIDGTRVVMTSSPSASLGVTIKKEFAVDSSGWITLAYTITASGSAAVSFGPWEVTRVPYGGLSFFPTGTEPATAPATEGAGATWLNTSAVTTEGKYAADGGGGWLAHVSGELLLIKQFVDQPPPSIASGQKEVELYTKPPGYEEVEVHGLYSNLAPGASVTWTVKWLLSRVPAGTSVEPGSAALVALVDSLLP